MGGASGGYYFPKCDKYCIQPPLLPSSGAADGCGVGIMRGQLSTPGENHCKDEEREKNEVSPISCCLLTSFCFRDRPVCVGEAPR